jgi:AraC family transcriptional regulator
VKASTLQDYRARLIRVFVHIQRHLDGPLALDDLAGLAGFSPFHFHRVFRGMTGESVQAHIRRLRLERAAQRLKHGGRSILEIALDAGYDSHEAFTRAFKAAAWPRRATACITGRTARSMTSRRAREVRR